MGIYDHKEDWADLKEMYAILARILSRQGIATKLSEVDLTLDVVSKELGLSLSVEIYDFTDASHDTFPLDEIEEKIATWEKIKPDN